MIYRKQIRVCSHYDVIAGNLDIFYIDTPMINSS